MYGTSQSNLKVDQVKISIVIKSCPGTVSGITNSNSNELKINDVNIELNVHGTTKSVTGIIENHSVGTLSINSLTVFINASQASSISGIAT